MHYWIGVASLEHVKRGVEENFAQVCHGKPGPLKCMTEGDWIVYYSPTVHFEGKDPCQSFTAIGEIQPGDPYTFAMSVDFVPWRRNVNFVTAKSVPIQPLVDKLRFIKDKKRWSFPFKRGCFEISEGDFQLIAQAMGIQ